MKSPTLLKALALAVGIVTAGSASAASIEANDQVTIEDAAFWAPSDLYRSVKIQLDGSGTDVSVPSGLFDIDATKVDGGAYVRLLAFCLQPEATLTKFDNPYTAVSLGSSAVVGDADGIAKLWAAYRGSVVDDTSAAAFQLAVWELAYDGDTNLSTGDFMSVTASAALTLANQWLASLSGLTAKASNLLVLTDNSNSNLGDKQDLLIQTPIPGTLGLLGLGLLGLGGLRRKAKV